MFRNLCFLFIFLLVGCGSIKSGKVSCSNASVVLNYENAILIDVRSASEYKSGHMDGAINIPYDNILLGVSRLENVNFDTPIVVYCKSGGRSAQAFSTLKDAGYKNVYDLGAMSKCDV